MGDYSTLNGTRRIIEPMAMVPTLAPVFFRGHQPATIEELGETIEALLCREGCWCDMDDDGVLVVNFADSYDKAGPQEYDFLKAIAPFVEPYDRMADTGEIAVTYYDESWSLYYTGTDLVTAEPIEIWPLPPGDDSSRPLTANEQLVAGVLAKVFAFQPDNPALAAIVTALGDAEVLAPVPAKVRDWLTAPDPEDA